VTTALATSDRGRVYTDFIFAELEREHERRASAQSRASSLSGFGTGAVSLAGAGLVFVFGQGHAITPVATVLLLVTLVAFIVSTGLAARVFAIGHTYRVPDAKGYRVMVGSRWSDSEEAARRATAAFAVRTITTLRAGNNRSATLLEWAGYLQVEGLAALGLALVVEFIRALA